MAVTTPSPATLVLRFADVGVATYASLRVIGEPSRTVAWVVEESPLVALLHDLAEALPEPLAGESVVEAVARALTVGPFASPEAEAELAAKLGATLLSADAWNLLLQFVAAPRAALFISPSSRLARMPWCLLARSAGERLRLLDLVEVLLAIPPNIANAPRRRTAWTGSDDAPSLLILDPRVPGQRPDSALGSVLGRPSPVSALSVHFADVVLRQRVLPRVAAPVELFRRTDADRGWLSALLTEAPGRLLYVGHASAAEDRSGRADQAALHLAEDRPLTAADIMAGRMPMPPRVALLACASGGDYRFDEATGLVAATILAGAQLVTATLWSLPTAAGYQRFTGGDSDPMAELVCGVDHAHDAVDGGRAVNQWQRDLLLRWLSGDRTASPLYWAALVTFAVDGAR